MQPAKLDGMPTATREGDLFFKCERCDASLVVDRVAAGMILTCQECGDATTVPRGDVVASSAKISAEREAELRRHLKENESQRTEITGHMNQLNIQLHRSQLRLQTLNERNAELKTEITAPASAVPPVS